MGNQRKCIAVCPAAELEERKNLFAGLSDLLPVVFETFDPQLSHRPDACIFLGAQEAEVPSDVPCYVCDNSPDTIPLTELQVKFASRPELHPAIRGSCLTESTPREIASLSLQSGETVVAEVSGRPIWTVRGITHRVAVAPPRLGAEEGLFTYLEARRWVDLLPLMHFLRAVCNGMGWEEPPLRACFVFDDPNLHAFTYGHVDFRRIAREAQEHNYHVVFAMVPADGWYVNRMVAQFFAEQSKYLSLTVHGVEHTRAELRRVNGAGLRLLALGLRRIDRFDSRSGLEVSRVMVPPHEGWSNSITNTMLRLGYEGACVSTEQLTSDTPETIWRHNLTLGPVSWAGDGFPLLHRFSFVKSSAETGIRLAAFLGRPVILKGHHQDCSSGLDILRQRADLVNKLGGRWESLKAIMRSNYRTRRMGDKLEIRMYSRRIQLQVPGHVNTISIERPWLKEGGQERLQCGAANGWCAGLAVGRVTDPLSVTSGANLQIFSVPKEQVDYRSVPPTGLRLWAVVRRALVEGRDRLQPLLGV